MKRGFLTLYAFFPTIQIWLIEALFTSTTLAFYHLYYFYLTRKETRKEFNSKGIFTEAFIDMLF